MINKGYEKNIYISAYFRVQIKEQLFRGAIVIMTASLDLESSHEIWSYLVNTAKFSWLISDFINRVPLYMQIDGWTVQLNYLWQQFVLTNTSRKYKHVLKILQWPPSYLNLYGGTVIQFTNARNRVVTMFWWRRQVWQLFF